MGNADSKRAGRLRLAGRWLALLTAVVLAWPVNADTSKAVIVPALSPFVALCSILAVRAVSVLALLAVPVLVMVLLRPRWFCRHACPTGFLQELVQKLRGGQRRWSRFPAIGQWVALLTIGGACVGYPVLLWLDPLALWSGSLNAWRQPLGVASLLAGLGLPGLLLLSFAFPGLWCRRICPLGATQELLAWPRRWHRHRNCRRGEEPFAPSGGPSVARRLFLGTGLGAAGAVLVRAGRAEGHPPPRPPGALDEQRFTAVCVRCGNCAQVCPSKIIHSDFGRSGLAGLLTPILNFEVDYCRENCHRCNQVCPSGAIARISLAEKRRRVIGPAAVDLEQCLLANGRECTACLRACPYEALTMETSDGGFSSQPRVDLAKCTGCGACETVCPVRPQRAIRVVPGRQT